MRVDKVFSELHTVLETETERLVCTILSDCDASIGTAHRVFHILNKSKAMHIKLSKMEKDYMGTIQNMMD